MLDTIAITDIAASRTIEPALLYFGTPVDRYYYW